MLFYVQSLLIEAGFLAADVVEVTDLWDLSGSYSTVPIKHSAQQVLAITMIY